MRDLPEVRDLEAFVAVADTGSFTAAAQSLLLTQPTVSARIASLEAALDAKLLDRGPGGVKCTPVGEIVLERARRLLRDRLEIADTVHHFLGRPGGTLELGASSIPGAYLLPPLIADLRKAHPGIRVRLDVSDTDETLAQLRSGRFELAIVGREVKEEGLVSRRIWKDEILFVASPELVSSLAGDLGPRSIQSLPIVLRETGSGTRAAGLAALERAGAPFEALNIVLEVSGNVGAREAALQGIGATFLSRFAVEESLASGRLVAIPLPGSPLTRHFALLTRSGRTLSPAAAKLVRLLEQVKRD
jgi:DNA-binding transcriptional LysR family regulator